MRFPDEDAYRYAGRLKRLWYKIICPFTHGSRLWIVTTSILNNSVTMATHRSYRDNLSCDASCWWATPAISRDTSVLLIPHLKGASSSDYDLDSWPPSLVNVANWAQASTLPNASSIYRLSNDAVRGWNNLQARSATPLYDDLIVARISPTSSPWHERILALAPSPSDHIVGLTPAPGPSRSIR